MMPAVANNTTMEHASLWNLPPWLDDANKISEQNVIVGNFQPSINSTSDTEVERQDWEETSTLGSRFFYLSIPDSSSTVLVKQPTDWSDNSTAETEKPEALTEELKRIFFAAREEVFEDGMDSVFSRRLIMFMKRYSRLGIDILSELLILERVNAEVAGEALRYVGYLEHSETHISRRRLLEHCLFGSSARIRDGAILGIAAMDDPKSIPFVEQAVERERISGLKEDIMDVLDQLHETLAEA
ncbi:MAG: hypothetical protein OXH77_11670 [Anaerolineaceae bacterium]|nr:hypothetical protein [Anaerolineaceae bacterium]